MTNSRASGGTMVKLDAHLATGTEATYTFTPTNPLNMKTKYAWIDIQVTGKATAALGLILIINASTDYNGAIVQNDSTTLAAFVVDANVNCELLSNALIDGATDFQATARIYLNDASDLLCVSSRGGSTHEGQHLREYDVQDSATTITTIELKTSTSTWIAGTEMLIYGVLR